MFYKLLEHFIGCHFLSSSGFSLFFFPSEIHSTHNVSSELPSFVYMEGEGNMAFWKISKALTVTYTHVQTLNLLLTT